MNGRQTFEVAGGAVAVVTGIRTISKHARAGDRLELLRAVLKIVVAVVGIVIAMRAVEDAVDEVSS